jgi:hypothetical protein
VSHFRSGALDGFQFWFVDLPCLAEPLRVGAEAARKLEVSVHWFKRRRPCRIDSRADNNVRGSTLAHSNDSPAIHEAIDWYLGLIYYGRDNTRSACNFYILEDSAMPGKERYGIEIRQGRIQRCGDKDTSRSKQGYIVFLWLVGTVYVLWLRAETKFRMPLRPPLLILNRARIHCWTYSGWTGITPQKDDSKSPHSAFYIPS